MRYLVTDLFFICLQPYDVLLNCIPGYLFPQDRSIFLVELRMICTDFARLNGWSADNEYQRCFEYREAILSRTLSVPDYRYRSRSSAAWSLRKVAESQRESIPCFIVLWLCCFRGRLGFSLPAVLRLHPRCELKVRRTATDHGATVRPPLTIARCVNPVKVTARLALRITRVTLSSGVRKTAAELDVICRAILCIATSTPIMLLKT